MANPLNIVELRDQRESIFKLMKASLDVAEKEGRELTGEERQTYERLEAEFDALSEKISTAERALVRDIAMDGLPYSFGSDERADSKHPLLTRDQKLADWTRSQGFSTGAFGGEPRLSFSKFIRGITLGDWHDAENEYRAMSEGTAAAGGYLVPTPLSSDIIDKARALARVVQAGAVTVPMTAQTLKVARLSGDPTAAWKVENDPITASDAQFEVVEFTAQTLIALIRASRELVEDAQGLEETLTRAFAGALALELDRVALRGTGTAPEPKGLFTYSSGVNVTSMGTNGAQLTSYDKVIDAYQQVREDNHEPNGALIMSPRTAATIAKFKDSQNQPLRRPTDLEGARILSTNQVINTDTQGTANNASAIYLGDFSQLMIGMRTNLTIEVLKERYSDNHQIGFVAALRADVQLAHPEAFSVVKGIIP